MGVPSTRLQTEKVKDERALLCALQICLALLQDPNYADDEVRIMFAWQRTEYVYANIYFHSLQHGSCIECVHACECVRVCLSVLQDSIGQLLSLVLRIHETHAVALPTVAHTASSTVRQVRLLPAIQ